MDKNTGLLVFLVSLLLVVSIVGLAVVGSNQVDQEALKNDIAAQVIAELPSPEPVVVPSAAEIAALVEIPEAPAFESDSKVLDLWENQYSVEIEELEDEAYDVAELELEDHDYKLLTKWLEAEIEGFDELKDVDVEDYEITIVELGLEDEDDKAAEVVFELEVRYLLEEGPAQAYKMNILMTADVLFDEGDFSDEEVVLAFA